MLMMQASMNFIMQRSHNVVCPWRILRYQSAMCK